jgi:plectin
MNPTYCRFAALILCGVAGAFGFATTAVAQVPQETIERLRRDQDEILHKTERLQSLMQRLQQRYEREGKQEQVKLLQEGMAHLERSGVLRDVASIRDDLAATAFSEALRKQHEVVDDLERLLNILLERKSIENIDQQSKLAAEQAATARELEQRQRDLQTETQNALQREPSAAEKQMLEQLHSLQRAEAKEAERNAQQAGLRRPFLESALQRVQQLLNQQERLEAGAADEASGRTTQNRERQFELGSLMQRARDLASQVRGQERQGELQKAAESLREQASGNDQQALRQARDRFESLVQNAPKLPGGSEGPVRDAKWDAVRDNLRKAPEGATPAERQELQQIAEEAVKLAAERAASAGARNAEDSKKLAADTSAAAERLRPGEAGVADDKAPSQSLSKAAENLDAAGKLAESGVQKPADVDQAKQKIDQALSALERARAQENALHPDAEKQAGQMAAEAAAAAQELQNAPAAEDAEKKASGQLDDAAKALRSAESAIGKSRDEGKATDVKQDTTASRQALEQAKQTLEQALAGATQDRTEDLQSAAQRQQEIAQQTEAAKQALQQAAQNGQITEQQKKAASEAVQRAQQRMQEAGKQLQAGNQSSASGQQQEASKQLQDAAEQLQKNQPVTEEQKQALAEQAKKQEKLAEDIVKLAKELAQRDNKAAQQKAQQAAEAAKKAQRGLEEGDVEQTQQQQEEARQKLQEAAEELEEEKDRYQELRQEELLFKMKEELTAFLERQRPITQETLAAQEAQKNEALSRPARKKLNQLGEQELELAGKVEFLTTALQEEGNLVYQAVLRANLEDLREVSRRLGGRSPDPSTFTTMMQQDVERRSEELLAALERERQRREQKRKQEQQDQQQPKGQNKFNPQREKLVSLIAELEMLKRLQQDTGRATRDLHTLVESRGDELVSEAEVELVERLAHRHTEITRLFQQIKAGVEETMKAMENMQGGGEPQPGKGK